MSSFIQSFAFADAVLHPLLHLPQEQEAARAAGLSRQQASVRYPSRLVRYLLPYAWMREVRAALGRPLRVGEIGTGSGQMKRLADFLHQHIGGGQALYSSWQGFDIAPQTEALAKAGYGTVEPFNADEPLRREFCAFDVVLLLHVLEHLQQPEEFMARLVQSTDAGTVLLGGVPAVPDFLVGIRQVRLRQKYLPGGHWCQFSAKRVRRMTHRAGLRQVVITGAFLLRASGSALENNLAWMRWNLALAHLLPWWPGEVYFRGETPPPPAPNR